MRMEEHISQGSSVFAFEQRGNAILHRSGPGRNFQADQQGRMCGRADLSGNLCDFEADAGRAGFHAETL